MWDNDMKRTSSYLATWSQYRSSGTIGSSILKVLVTDTEVIWLASVAVTRHKVLSFLWWVIISPHLLQCTRQGCLWSYHMGQWQYPRPQLQGSSYRVAHHQIRWKSKLWLRNCWSWEPILSWQKEFSRCCKSSLYLFQHTNLVFDLNYSWFHFHWPKEYPRMGRVAKIILVRDWGYHWFLRLTKCLIRKSLMQRGVHQ